MTHEMRGAKPGATPAPDRRRGVDHTRQPNAVQGTDGQWSVPPRPTDEKGGTRVPVVPTNPVGAV